MEKWLKGCEALLLLVYLSLLALQDLKTRSVDPKTLWAGAAMGLLCRGTELLLGLIRFRDLLPLPAGAVFGILLLFLSRGGEKNVGRGDGFVLLSLCPWLRPGELLSLLLLALTLLSLWGLVLWLRRGRKGKTSLPLMPFLAGGQLLLALAAL